MTNGDDGEKNSLPGHRGKRRRGVAATVVQVARFRQPRPPW
jgi:hypothetical protein